MGGETQGFFAKIIFQMTGDYKDFQGVLNSFSEKFITYKAVYFKKQLAKQLLPEDLNFFRDLEAFMEGGKKMRAFLVYLGFLCGGGRKVSAVLQVALGYEILHSFFLIHDDFLDNSALRRGKETIHIKYGKRDVHFGDSIALLWGDLAFVEATRLFAEAGNIDVLRRYIDTTFKTGIGQVLDVSNSGKKIGFFDIQKVNDLKTANYSVISPLVIGALLANARTSQIVAMEKFGLYAGRAFQLQDDYLGIFGDEKILGKSVLSDMREGKNTLLIYKARELGTALDCRVIDSLWGNSDAKMADLEKIREIIKKSGACVWYEGEMLSIVNRAGKYVKSMTNDVELQKVIEEMADFIVTRAN